jgi:hypothetical protein
MMSDYKRLTTKDEEGNWQVWEDDYSHPFEALQVAIDRLAEWENDYESGKVVKLPCKVGDTVYWVWEEFTNGKQKLSIEEWEVEKICIEKNEWSVKGLGEEIVEGVRQFFWCHSSRFGIWWFLTREEAEKKLKELQNG